MHTHMYMYMHAHSHAHVHDISTVYCMYRDYKFIWGTSIRDRLLQHSRIDLKSNLISKVRFPIIYLISNIATKRTSNEIWQIEVTHLSIKVVHSEQLYCREKAQLIHFPGDLEVFTNILFTEGVQQPPVHKVSREHFGEMSQTTVMSPL